MISITDYTCINDILEDCSIETENKWNDLIPKDIENILNGMLFDTDIYYNYSAGTDRYCYKIIKELSIFKSGKNKGNIKEVIVQECLGDGELLGCKRMLKYTGKNWKITHYFRASIFIGDKDYGNKWIKETSRIYMSKGWVQPFLDPCF